MMHGGPRWDIFCTVVDNFGDIGIAWRLARQLANEQRQQVRLWVDDLASFRAIRPEIDPAAPLQTFSAVDIRSWRADMPAFDPGDVVVEALACHLPEAVEQAMARRTRKPVWVNLEYLSAEPWVPGCHGLPSPHPRLPLSKYFFMPGYVRGTGGVQREDWLERERDAFQADAVARDRFWHAWGVPPEDASEVRISLFGYENAAADGLLRHWAQGRQAVRCLVPEGWLLADVARGLGLPRLRPGACERRGRLTVQVLPMLDQDSYDRLLWACDCNFVRGEDSFVRAQWALKPLVWQAYRQDELAHMEKLDAFLGLYGTRLAEPSASAMADLWRAWNLEEAADRYWDAYWSGRPALLAGTRQWASHLRSLGDLAENLVKFCVGKL